MAAGDYGYVDLLDECKRAGWRYGAGLVTAIAVSLAENSARDLLAVYVNADGSRDRGPWQINDRWQPQVTDAEAFNLRESTREAFAIYTGWGRSFTAWSAYNNGRYERFLDVAYLLNSFDQQRTTAQTLQAALISERAAHQAARDALATERQDHTATRALLSTALADLDAMRQARDDALALAADRQSKIVAARAALG